MAPRPTWGDDPKNVLWVPNAQGRLDGRFPMGGTDLPTPPPIVGDFYLELDTGFSFSIVEGDGFETGSILRIVDEESRFGNKPFGSLPLAYIPHDGIYGLDTSLSRLNEEAVIYSGESIDPTDNSVVIDMTDSANNIIIRPIENGIRYMFIHEKFEHAFLDDDIHTNLKVIRTWRMGTSKSFIVGFTDGQSEGADKEVMLTVENIGMPDETPRWAYATAQPESHAPGIPQLTTEFVRSLQYDWMRLELEYDYGTAGESDGKAIPWFNGRRPLRAGTSGWPNWTEDGVSNWPLMGAGTQEGVFNEFASTQISNNNEPPGAAIKYGAILLDDSRCRVIISEEDTWNVSATNSVIRDFCVPVLWSANTIDIYFRQGVHEDMDNKKIWIVTENGTPIKIGTIRRLDDINHGQTFTISGDSFGTRNIDIDIFDDTTENNPTNIWDQVDGLVYRTPAEVNRGVDLPHTNISRFLCGKTGDSGWLSNLWVAANLENYENPTKMFCMSYRRMDPNWVFGENTSQENDNNTKFFTVSAGGGVFETPYWYHDQTKQKHNLEDYWDNNFASNGGLGSFSTSWSGSQGGGLDQNNDPWYNWCKFEYRVGLGPDENLKFLTNNNVYQDVSNLNIDNSTDTRRSFGIGLYSRESLDSRWIYLSDIVLVVGEDAFKRVILHDNENYEQSNVVEFQPITQWSNTNIEIRINKGKIGSGIAFLSIFNSNDEIIKTIKVNVI